MRKSQAGFSVVEIVIVVILMVLIGEAGYYVYHNHGKTTNVSSFISNNQFLPASPSQFGDYGNIPAKPQPAVPDQPLKVGNLVNKNEYQAVIFTSGSGTRTVIGNLKDGASVGTWQLNSYYEFDNSTKTIKIYNFDTLSIKSTTVVEWTNLTTNQKLVSILYAYQQAHAPKAPQNVYECKDTHIYDCPASNQTAGVTNPTANWIPLSFPAAKFSFKYPNTWSIAADESYCPANVLFLGANKDSVGSCRSGGTNTGQIGVLYLTGDQRASNDINADDCCSNVTKESVTVSGVTGSKETATEANTKEGKPVGTKIEQYGFYDSKTDITYAFVYAQIPNTPNVLSDFETMVTKTLSFSN